MSDHVEDALDKLSAIISDLKSVKEKVTNGTDRGALNSQIRALAKWWRKIDDERAGTIPNEIATATKELGKISTALKADKKKLQNVAATIRRAAQAIAIAERVFKLAA